jgi:hypothetical protein
MIRAAGGDLFASEVRGEERREERTETVCCPSCSSDQTAGATPAMTTQYQVHMMQWLLFSATRRTREGKPFTRPLTDTIPSNMKQSRVAFIGRIDL